MHYRIGGFIFGGAYTWRGLFSEFYGIIPGSRNISDMDILTAIFYQTKFQKIKMALLCDTYQEKYAVF